MSAASHAPKAALPLAILGIVIVIVAALYQAFDWTFLNTGTEAAPITVTDTYYKVTGVADGDTLYATIEGNEERIRLLGINTPEVGKGETIQECFGEEASKRMKELAQGELVRLEYDETQSLRDSYGRLLAYVYLQDGQMLNRKMIAEGYAYEYTYMNAYAHQADFREVQNLARGAGRGLWGGETCNGKK